MFVCMHKSVYIYIYTYYFSLDWLCAHGAAVQNSQRLHPGLLITLATDTWGSSVATSSNNTSIRKT